MTKKQRHEHYKLVLRKTENKEYHFTVAGFCDRSALELYGNSLLFNRITKSKFPEFWLFKPIKHCHTYWFRDFDGIFSCSKEEAEEHRLIALEFCIAMTE